MKNIPSLSIVLADEEPSAEASSRSKLTDFLRAKKKLLRSAFASCFQGALKERSPTLTHITSATDRASFDARAGISFIPAKGCFADVSSWDRSSSSSLKATRSSNNSILAVIPEEKEWEAEEWEAEEWDEEQQQQQSYHQQHQEMSPRPALPLDWCCPGCTKYKLQVEELHSRVDRIAGQLDALMVLLGQVCELSMPLTTNQQDAGAGHQEAEQEEVQEQEEEEEKKEVQEEEKEKEEGQEEDGPDAFLCRTPVSAHTWGASSTSAHSSDLMSVDCTSADEPLSAQALCSSSRLITNSCTFSEATATATAENGIAIAATCSEPAAVVAVPVVPDASATTPASASPAVAAASDEVTAAFSSGALLDQILALNLDPDNIPDGAFLFRPPEAEDGMCCSLTWRADLAAGPYLVKVFPFYSQELAAEVKEAAEKAKADRQAQEEEGETKEALQLPSRKNAMTEVSTNTDINTASARRDRAVPAEALGRDVFVSPLHVLERPCSRRFTSSEIAGPDREIVAVYPYLSGGNGVDYLVDTAVTQIAACAEGELSEEQLAQSLQQLMADAALSMFELVARVHDLGFVLRDHKLENMAFDLDKGTWHLIDAAELRMCPLGSRSEGASAHTPMYAPPEQKESLWVDSRSDVFSCGRSFQLVFSDILGQLDAHLGADSGESLSAEEALRAQCEKLLIILSPCMAAGADERPSAADTRDKLKALCGRE